MREAITSMGDSMGVAHRRDGEMRRCLAEALTLGVTLR